MLSIFSDFEALKSICSLEEHPNWREVLANQVNVYTNINDATLMGELDKEEESPLFMFYHENMGAKEPVALGDQFQFDQDNATMIDEPYGMFILDIDKKEANEISAKYGIEVFSSQELEDLKDFSIEDDFEEGDSVQCSAGKLKGYKYLLDTFNDQKSNSSIIIDRNLFSNEQRGANLGIANMINYFDSILPDSFDTSYDILFIAQFAGRITKQVSRDKIVSDLHKDLSTLRTYQINVELLLVNSSTSIFGHTHQRRILKNYHYGNSEHGFVLFKANRPDIIYCDNDFLLHNHYHSLLQKQNTDISIRRRTKLFNRLSDIKTDAEYYLKKDGQSDYAYRLYNNGVEAINITNRLLN